jgi:hypothetical protein
MLTCAGRLPQSVNIPTDSPSSTNRSDECMSILDMYVMGQVHAGSAAANNTLVSRLARRGEKGRGLGLQPRDIDL